MNLAIILISGYFQNDTELFSSQEKVKFKGVIELYNKYAKEFLQEAISTKRSRKKTTLLTTLKIIENSAEILPQHKHMKCLTRPYIHCNLSDFILNP